MEERERKGEERCSVNPGIVFWKKGKKEKKVRKMRFNGIERRKTRKRKKEEMKR